MKTQTFRCLVVVAVLFPLTGIAKERWDNGKSQTVPAMRVQPRTNDDWAKNFVNTRIVTPSWNWSVSPSGSLSAGSNTIKIPADILGISVSGDNDWPYWVYLQGGGLSEAALVTGGTYTAASGGTIVITNRNNYGPGYSVGSATSGIQEAINDGCGKSPIGSRFNNTSCHIIIPPSGQFAPDSSYGRKHFNTFADYNIFATIIFEASGSEISGYGAVLNCYQRSYCLQMGDLVNANYYANNTVEGLSFRTPWNTLTGQYGIYGYGFKGCDITKTERTAQVVTIATTGCQTRFQIGDMITVMFTDNPLYWGDAIVTAVGDRTISYAHRGPDLAAQTTPGVVAEAFGAIYDNGNNNKFNDISYDQSNEIGHFNTFFDFQDDENAKITGFSNNGISLQATSTWSGSFVQSLGNIGLNPAPTAAAVISVRDSNFTPNSSNCFTVLNSNGLYVENTVCQAQGLWMAYVSNTNGNYQGADFTNLYSESSSSLNRLSPANTPFAGTGSAGGLIGRIGAQATVSIRGNGGMGGVIPAGGSGAHRFTYFVVVNDVTNRTHSNPMLAYQWASTCVPSALGSGCLAGNTDHPEIRWPRVARGTDVITYTVLRISTSINSAVNPTSVMPYFGNCNGGAAAACGSVVVGQAQGTELVQTFTDTSSAVTTPYNFSPAHFAPSNFYWPGTVVLAGGVVLNTDTEQSPTAFSEGGPLEIAKTCGNYGQVLGGGYTQCLWTHTGNAQPNQTAFLLPDGPGSGGGMIQSKGRLNFTSAFDATMSAHHVITIQDSVPWKTQNTVNMRPLADAADTWIGEDQPTSINPDSVQLAFGSPTCQSWYIHNVGDNVNWAERMCASGATFRVPVTANSLLTSTVGTGSPPLKISSTTPVANLTLTAHPQVYEAGILTPSEKVYTNTLKLAAGLAKHTFSNGFAFAGSSTFGCLCTDQTAANACSVHPESATTVQLLGTGTDLIWLSCTGH